MCPLRVCTVCGQPSRRIVEQTNEEYSSAAEKAKKYNGLKRTDGEVGVGMGYAKGSANKAQSLIQNGAVVPVFETVGWSSCGHNQWRPGLVLDPFAGSGTTLQVATGHGLDTIGIDLDPRNAQLAVDRVGPLLLTVETLKEVAS
jgi:hypothetical protein